MTETSKTITRKARHIPRRSGVGTRQVIAARLPKGHPYRSRGTAPAVCGALHPDLGQPRHSLRDGAALDLVVCTARIQYRDGKPVKHRGPHRAKVAGVLLRWTGDAR